MAKHFRITRPQREAVKRVYDRQPIIGINVATGETRTMTYREFRAMAEPTFGMDGAIVLPWAGMWLAIETDGYTHS